MVSERTEKELRKGRERRIKSLNSSYKEGCYFIWLDNNKFQQVQVECIFYPKVRWTWRTEDHIDGEWVYGDKQTLTDEIWNKLEKLRL